MPVLHNGVGKEYAQGQNARKVQLYKEKMRTRLRNPADGDGRQEQKELLAQVVLDPSLQIHRLLKESQEIERSQRPKEYRGHVFFDEMVPKMFL